MLWIDKLIIAAVAATGVVIASFVGAAAQGLADTTLSFYFMLVLILDFLSVLNLFRIRDAHAHPESR